MKFQLTTEQENQLKTIPIQEQARWVQKTLGCSIKTARRRLSLFKKASTILRGYVSEQIIFDEPQDMGMTEAEHYIYNKHTDQYVVSTKKTRSGWVVLSGEDVRALRREYVQGTASKEEISKKYTILRPVIDDVFKAFDLKQTSSEHTREELVNKSASQLVTESLERKAFEIKQETEKQQWKQIQKEAAQWREMKAGEFDPWKRVVEDWKGIPAAPAQIVTEGVSGPFVGAAPQSAYNAGSEDCFVVALSDLHYGSATRARYVLNGKGWTTQDTIGAVANYRKAITREALNRRSGFKKCIVLCLGDLIHSVSGKTARGTELQYDVVREEQFEYALDSLASFFEGLAETFQIVEVHDVGGNHFYEMDMALLFALAKYFRHDKRFRFTHHASRPAAFREGATLFMLDHGADAIERTYVPKTDTGRETHILNIMAQHPQLLEGAKTRLFCQGDKHHWEHWETNNFEFIMFGTVIGEDLHSQKNNLNNRARQSCLIINDTLGHVDTIHVTFD